jgi:hypothetical protein
MLWYKCDRNTVDSLPTHTPLWIQKVWVIGEYGFRELRVSEESTVLYFRMISVDLASASIGGVAGRLRSNKLLVHCYCMQ